LELLCQLPIQLNSTSAPEPDFALVKPLSSDAVTGHPQADEVLLTIEVASSSLNDDRNCKQLVFARAGIPEYWIVNRIAKQLEVFQVPDIQQGRYQQPNVLTVTDTIKITGLSGKSVSLPVADLL
jgi:Uma2 family endonuclease